MRRIGRYDIVNKVVSTFFSDLYRSRDPDGQPVAIKVFNPKPREDDNLFGHDIEFWRQRFVDEATILDHFDHPNIVSLIDSGETEAGAPYLVMPFIASNLVFEMGRDLLPNENLADVSLPDRPLRLPPARAIKLWRQVLLALAKVHGAGLVHRDVTPSNILVTVEGSGDAVLCDFHLAKVPGAPGSPQGELMGPVRYRSPEQQQRTVDVDSRADVFGAGCLAFRMVTGRHPDTLGVPLRNAGTGLPVAAVKLIQRCLSIDRDERPWDAQAVLDELDAACPVGHEFVVPSRRPRPGASRG